MKLILGYIPLLLTCLICAVISDTPKPESVTVSGTDIVYGTGGTTPGTVVTAIKETDQIRVASSKTIAGQLLPSWCAYTDKGCPGLKDSDFTQQPGTAKEDCMRACKTNNCLVAEFYSGMCYWSSQTCSTGPNAENLISAPGVTLMVRRKDGDPTTCPGGAGPVGLPEDQFTSEFCITNNVRCPVDNTFHSIFKATVEQCKYECNAYAACAEAVFILGDVRYCYLLDRPCQPSELIPDTLSTTLYRMPRTQYDNYRQGQSGTNICPLGGIRYIADGGPPYIDKFCLYAQKKACPTADGNMYQLPGQDLTAAACLSKCLVYNTCGVVEWYQVMDNSGTLRNRCNMKDSPLCLDADLVGPPPNYIAKYNVNYTTPDCYKVYQHYIRLKASDNGICPGAYAPVPGFVSWTAKYCIWYDRVCPAKNAPVLSVTPATDLNDCLIQCYRSVSGSCKSATFDSYLGQCTQLSGVCTQTQLVIAPYQIYYIRQTDVNAVCPPLSCPDNSSPMDAPISPDTCANPTGSAASTILTNRCVCNAGYLDQEGVCVPKDNCPVKCPQKTPYTPVLVGTTQQTQIWRVYNFGADEIGNSCGTGATVQNMIKPCANMKGATNANSLCALPPNISCHCSGTQVWDPVARACV